HDLNLAARYADYHVVLHDGQVASHGAPREVVNPTMLRDVFGVEAEITPDPRTGTPLVIPLHLTGPAHDDAVNGRVMAMAG
ncbi:MAG: ABC transporter ATP-binding protein, partial [Thermomicrobiales bacterium]